MTALGPTRTSGEVSYCAASSIAGSAGVPLLSGKARHAAVDADELQQQDDDEDTNDEDRNASRHLRRDLREVPLGRPRPGRGKLRSTAHANRHEARQASEQLDGRNVERFAQRWHADRR